MPTPEGKAELKGNIDPTRCAAFKALATDPRFPRRTIGELLDAAVQLYLEHTATESVVVGFHQQQAEDTALLLTAIRALEAKLPTASAVPAPAPLDLRELRQALVELRRVYTVVVGIRALLQHGLAWLTTSWWKREPYVPLQGRQLGEEAGDPDPGQVSRGRPALG